MLRHNSPQKVLIAQVDEHHIGDSIKNHHMNVKFKSTMLCCFLIYEVVPWICHAEGVLTAIIHNTSAGSFTQQHKSK